VGWGRRFESESGHSFCQLFTPLSKILYSWAVFRFEFTPSLRGGQFLTEEAIRISPKTAVCGSLDCRLGLKPRPPRNDGVNSNRDTAKSFDKLMVEKRSLFFFFEAKKTTVRYKRAFCLSFHKSMFQN
jgi:hypothetical protein